MSIIDREAAPDTDWKRLRRFALLQIALIVCSAAVMLVIWGSVVRLEHRRDAVQRDLAEKERELAAKQQALQLTNEQLLAADNRERELRAGVQAANEALEQTRKLLAEVQSALPQRSAGLKTRVADSLNRTGAAERLVEKAARQVPPRIRIFYADGTQQATAERLAAVLKAQPYTVRDPTNLARTPGKPATDMTQVRFMLPEDRPSALEILSVIQANGVKHARLSYVPDPATRPGHIEIWFEAGEIR